MKMLADIVNDENWCRGSLALDELGDEVGINNPKAVKRCMIGWLAKKYPNSFDFGAKGRVYDVCWSRYKETITVVNDRLVKDASEVAAIFAEARV